MSDPYFIAYSAVSKFVHTIWQGREINYLNIFCFTLTFKNWVKMQFLEFFSLFLAVIGIWEISQFWSPEKNQIYSQRQLTPPKKTQWPNSSVSSKHERSTWEFLWFFVSKIKLFLDYFNVSFISLAVQHSIVKDKEAHKTNCKSLFHT